MKIDIKKYKHFSFDLWLTIIKSNPEFKIKRDFLLKEYFEIDRSIEEVKKSVRYYDLLCNSISEKTGKHLDRDVVFLQILNKLGKDIQGISQNELNTFFDLIDSLFLNEMPIIIWNDFENLLKQIVAEDKTISLLSNTAFIYGDSLKKVLENFNLEIYFSFMIFSDEVKFSKPNPKVFDLTYTKANENKIVGKSEILHIGDNIIADYDGAMNFGFDAQLINFK